MADIVGIRFKKAGKVYYFDPAGIELLINDHVVVETAQGLEIGQVAIAPRPAPAGMVVAVKTHETEQAANAPQQGPAGVAEATAVVEPEEATYAPETEQAATTPEKEAAAPRQETSLAGEGPMPLKPVLRKATPEDIQRCQELELKEKDAL